MNNRSYLTISVDDGHPSDLRAAELLSKFDFKSTFYIPARNPERELMSPNQIREIAARFEVGSHSFNHRSLTNLSNEEARVEINTGKQWIEDVISKLVTSFCYPQGKYHSGTIKLVRQAGFTGARTCRFNLSDYPKNPFLWGVSTHAYSHSLAVQIRHALLERNFLGISNFVLIHKLEQDWSKHFIHAVDFVEKHGGIAHLYFHSWEIEELGQWAKLENLLETISNRQKLIPVTNGELFQLWQKQG